jgi:hypothetical protein
MPYPRAEGLKSFPQVSFGMLSEFLVQYLEGSSSKPYVAYE